MHHNIKCMTLAAVSAQYKTTEAEHSRGCHHWTQGQGTCLLTVGCLIFSYLCFPALCSWWRYHVHWSIGQAIRFFSPEICVIWLASTYEGDIFCSLCTFASTAEYFLGCLRRWSYQAHRQSWGFLKSSTTKSIRFVNILRSWGLASSSVCYSSSVRRESRFWDEVSSSMILSMAFDVHRIYIVLTIIRVKLHLPWHLAVLKCES
jgi:hypothetical protein